MQQSDRAGLMYALAGFCLLTVGDSIIKGIDGAWPSTAVAALRFTIGGVVLGAILARQEGPQVLTSLPHAKIQWIRGAALAFATMCFFAGVWLMPLTEAIALVFTQPMFTAILAVIFLGERLRWQTGVAIVMAFIGVLIVLRPNFAEIGWAALLPLGNSLGIAVLMIGNRAAAGKGSVLSMQAYVAILAAVILVFAAIAGHFSGIPVMQVSWPSIDVVWRAAAVAFTATISHALIYMGTERAGAATVAPMTYGQLVMAAALGYVFYNEIPDSTAMFGASIIVASGLWLWSMGRVTPPVQRR